MFSWLIFLAKGSSHCIGVSFSLPGDTQVQRGAATALRISQRKGSFLRPPHVRDFVKEGYFFVLRYEVFFYLKNLPLVGFFIFIFTYASQMYKIIDFFYIYNITSIRCCFILHMSNNICPIVRDFTNQLFS